MQKNDQNNHLEPYVFGDVAVASERGPLEDIAASGGPACTGKKSRDEAELTPFSSADSDSSIGDCPADESVKAVLESLLTSKSHSMAERLHPDVVLKYAPCERIPSLTYAHFKRAADIICAAFALVILSPIFLVCAIAVRSTSAGPAVFKQKRWGRKRTYFECWKFRTMVEETPPNMPAASFEDKARYMTPVGDFLRRWSFDELPQLVNILKGDMSIVGPRPVIVAEESLIELREHLNADAVRPGLTGWAQVNGRNLVDNEEKAFLDGEYVANMSLALDARIFFRTIAVVVSRRGVDRKDRRKREVQE